MQETQSRVTDFELEYIVMWYRYLGDSICREGREDLGLDIRYAAEVIELLWQERKQG